MLIHTINQLHCVEFGPGSFDQWCVYLQRKGQPRYAPHDEEYFVFFKTLGEHYGATKVYADFIRIYEKTTAVIDASVIVLLQAIADEYSNDSEEVAIWFSVIYGGMIAEENKKGAILKKRIKRLAMHQLLLEKMEPAVAANFSKGKKWWVLNELMKERGFGM